MTGAIGTPVSVTGDRHASAPFGEGSAEPGATPARWVTDVLRDGDLVVAAQGVGEPTGLLADLLAAGSLPAQVELFVGLSHSRVLRDAPAGPPLVSFGAMGPLAPIAASGALRVIPCHFADVARLLQVRAPGRIVVLVQVSPADADGCHSLGLSVDYTYDLLAGARAVVAEVNDRVPVTSAPRVHGSAFAATVTTSRPMPRVPAAATGDTHERIAAHAAALVGDGATLQLGVGALPSVVGRVLGARRDLSVHSTLAGDWLLELARAGALAEDPGTVRISEAAGSDELYRYVACGPVAVRPVGELMDPGVLGSLRRFAALNSALEVDLTGQVNAEELPSGYVGGIGGQPELLRAAQRSPHGRSIVMLPSTTADGATSRIVRSLRTGSVTTLRSGVDFIVTEYGVADLRGRSLAERREALIAIAAPQHRAALAAP